MDPTGSSTDAILVSFEFRSADEDDLVVVPDAVAVDDLTGVLGTMDPVDSSIMVTVLERMGDPNPTKVEGGGTKNSDDSCKVAARCKGVLPSKS